MAKKLTCCDIVRKALRRAGYTLSPFQCRIGRPFKDEKGRPIRQGCFIEGTANIKLKRTKRKK